MSKVPPPPPPLSSTHGPFTVYGGGQDWTRGPKPDLTEHSGGLPALSARESGPSTWEAVGRYNPSPGEVAFVYRHSKTQSAVVLVYDQSIHHPDEARGVGGFFDSYDYKRGVLLVNGASVPLRFLNSMTRGNIETFLADFNRAAVFEYSSTGHDLTQPHTYPADLILNPNYRLPLAISLPERIKSLPKNAKGFSSQNVYLYPLNRSDPLVQYISLDHEGKQYSRFMVSVFQDGEPVWAQVHLEGDSVIGLDLDEITHHPKRGTVIHFRDARDGGRVTFKVKKGVMRVDYASLGALDSYLNMEGKTPLSLDINPRWALARQLRGKPISRNPDLQTSLAGAIEMHERNPFMMQAIWRLLGCDHWPGMTDEIRARWIREASDARGSVPKLEQLYRSFVQNEGGYTTLPSGDFEQGRMVGRGLSVGLGAGFKTWAENGDCSVFFKNVIHDGTLASLSEWTEKGILQLFKLSKIGGLAGFIAKTGASGLGSFSVTSLLDSSEADFKSVLINGFGFGALNSVLEMATHSYFKNLGFYGGLLSALASIGAPLLTTHIIEQSV